MRFYYTFDIRHKFFLSVLVIENALLVTNNIPIKISQKIPTTFIDIDYQSISTNKHLVY